MSAQERTIAWLWEAQCLDRIGLFPGQGPSESMFVVLKENKNYKKKNLKKKKEGFDSRAPTLILMLTPLASRFICLQ